MSNFEKPKLDGNIMTAMDNDNRTMITKEEEERDMTLDSLARATGDQAQAMMGGDVVAITAGDLPVVTAVPVVAAVEEVSTMEEVPMVGSVDPAMCSFSSAFMSADETVVSGDPIDPLAAAVIPASLVPEKEESEEIGGKGKRVVGRKQAVVDDDGESQSSKSAASADGDASLASSSGVKRKGFKRGRRTLRDVKDVDYAEEGKSDSESSVERRKKKKGKKGEVRVTPEEEMSDGKNGEPRGIIEQALEDLSSSVLGGAIMEWASKIDDIRVKSKKLQGKFSGEIRRCVIKIKEGTTLLVIRSEATGDPHS